MMDTNFRGLAGYFDSGDFAAEAEAAEPDKVRSGAADGREPMDAFTVRLPVSVLEAVRAIAREEGESTGAVLRRMVESAVAEQVSDQAVVPVSALKQLISLAENVERPQGRTVKNNVVRSVDARSRTAHRSSAGGRSAAKKAIRRRRIS